jgi:hypothetical protein
MGGIAMFRFVWPLLFLVFNGVMVVALLYITVIVHEFGHVAAAKLIDMRGEYLVTMGNGRQLFSLRIFGIPVRIYQNPFNQHGLDGIFHVLSVGRPWLLWEQMLVTGGGAIINLMLTTVSFLIMYHVIEGGVEGFSLVHGVSGFLMIFGGLRAHLDALPILERILFAFAATNNFAMWMSIIPITIGEYRTDGASILYRLRAACGAKGQSSRGGIDL